MIKEEGDSATTSSVRRFTNPRSAWLWAGILALVCLTLAVAVADVVRGRGFWLLINAFVFVPWSFRMWLALQNRTEIGPGTISLYTGRRRREISMTDVHKVTSSPYGPVSVHLGGGETLVLPSVQPEDAAEVRQLLALPTPSSQKVAEP